MAVLTFFGFVALVLCGFGLYAVVALTIAAVSTWLPARRAGRVDPVEALRAD